MSAQDLQPESPDAALVSSFWDDLELAPINPDSLETEFPPRYITLEDSVTNRMDIANILNEKDVDPPRNPHPQAVSLPLDDISNQITPAVHTPAGLPDCAFCPRKFDFHYQLDEHLIIDHEHPPRRCPHCLFACARIVDMKRHVKILHDTVTGRFHCYACEAWALTELDMKGHIRSKHSRCPYCNTSYMRLSAHERVCRKHPRHLMMLRQMEVASSSAPQET